MANPQLAVKSSARLNAAYAALPPWALVVASIISVQIGAATAKGLFETAGPGGVVFLRTLLAALFFWALWRPAPRLESRRALASAVLYGLSIVSMMLCFYSAIERIPLGVAVAVSFIGPLAVAVFGSRRALDLAWAGLAAAGILLLSPLSNAALDPLGVALAAGGGGCWAGYIYFSRDASRHLPGNAGLAFGMTVGALAGLPFGIGGALKALADPSLILLAAVMALLSSIIPFGLQFQALRRMPPRAAGLLLSLEPVVAALIGVIMLGEALGAREIAGIALVTLAAAATARSA